MTSKRNGRIVACILWNFYSVFVRDVKIVPFFGGAVSLRAKSPYVHGLRHEETFMKFIDPDHPFYRPLWRRLLLVGLCAAWTTVEFYNGQQTWGMIFLAVTAYAFAHLILFFKPSAAAEKPAGEGGDGAG
jgi:hypothetical protein